MNGINTVIEVLIVDDELDICFLLSSFLQQNNIHSAFVTSLAQAKEILQEKTPRLILLDNHLSDGMGLDLIPFIRENFPSVRIIMITAYDGHEENERALKSGASAFIGKPFTREDILNAIQGCEDI
jgi:DNA-binding response OmpR family regulator